MMMFLFIIAVIITSLTTASPMLERDGSDYDSAITIVPSTTIVSLAGSPTDFPIMWNDDEEPIEADPFFSINPNCKQDTKDIGNSGFPNRHAFYLQAINDALLIASSTSDWPLHNINASDVYFGVGAEQPKYSDDIAGTFNNEYGFSKTVLLTVGKENLRVAAHWDMPALITLS